jgi:hypothetical protein
MRLESRLITALCIISWIVIAAFPAEGYNSINESAEIAIPLNSAVSESSNVGFGQVIELNNSTSFWEESQNLTSLDRSEADSINISRPNCQSNLRIVDYWGNRYSCNAKCVFLRDVARMTVIPCKRGYIKLYEEYPDKNVVTSRSIPVYANRRYNWWFVGDVVGLHTLWFTIGDRYGQASRSNNVTFEVIEQNCGRIENCSPSR